MDDKDFWDRSADVLLSLAHKAAFLFAVGLVGWQTFGWLRTSEWPSVPFRLAFEFFNVDLGPVYSPTSWLGLAEAARMVLDLPLSLSGPAAVVCAAHAWKSFVSSGRCAR
jgi:hypothetical protein